MKLSRLAAGIHYYHVEHTALPAPSELKRQLLEHKLVEDESLFYSAPSGVEIRYFTSGNRFVLVSPGKDGRYDTPEGYHALEAIRQTGDDIVRFGHVGGEKNEWAD